MANYPTQILEFREKTNLPGMVYDPLKKTTLYADDLIGIEAEVLAIENALGLEPHGSYSDVTARLNDVDVYIGALSQQANTLLIDKNENLWLGVANGPTEVTIDTAWGGAKVPLSTSQKEGSTQIVHENDGFHTYGVGGAFEVSGTMNIYAHTGDIYFELRKDNVPIRTLAYVQGDEVYLNIPLSPYVIYTEADQQYELWVAAGSPGTIKIFNHSTFCVKKIS